MSTKYHKVEIPTGHIVNTEIWQDRPEATDAHRWVEIDAPEAVGLSRRPPDAVDTSASLIAAAQAAIASIYAPVPYLGKLYPVDTESMSKYEIAKQSRVRGKLKKGLAIATDGTILKLTGTAAIDAFHGAMEDAITARVEAAHDAI